MKNSLLADMLLCWFNYQEIWCVEHLQCRVCMKIVISMPSPCRSCIVHKKMRTIQLTVFFCFWVFVKMPAFAYHFGHFGSLGICQNFVRIVGFVGLFRGRKWGQSNSLNFFVFGRLWKCLFFCFFMWSFWQFGNLSDSLNSCRKVNT